MDGEQRSPKVIKPKRPFPLRNRKWCCCYSDALIFSSFTTTKKETNLFEPFIKKLQTRNKVHKLRHCRAMLSDADYSGNASGTRRAKKRSSEESPGESQTPRISGRQTNARVKRTNNPPPGQSKRKATDTEEEDDQSEKKYRKCEKAGCSATYPVCFASASERCAKNGYTSRWYHLSCGEHFCNECFDHYYRSHKDGYETFASWKRVWTSNGKSEPSLKAFMADQLLPYWVQCSRPDCRKWRQLTKEIQLTTALAATYRCGMKLSNIKMEGPDQCSQPEDLEVLTAEKCAEHIIVRGLVRVRCVQELDRVLHFMTRKGLINTGVLAVKRPLLPESFCSKNVIVIGAGAAGLAAARQLQNFGTQVLVLEARERIGGRVWDDVSLGVTVGRGAQIVNGCVNNPIALMCEQMGIRMHKLGERCDLFQEDGKVTDPAIDKRMDFHFNAILDVVSDWRKDKSQGQDSPLGEKVREIKKNFLQESGIQFSELEEKVLQFHLSNLEFACGSSLDQVSARSWDHNEFFAQFSGDHTLLTEGYSPLLRRLAEGLDIRTNCPVQAVDYSGDLVKVSSSGGSQWSAHRVLVSVPLTLLQKNVLRFTPPLPERKLKAIHSLGAGIIEKVALQFPYRFWDTKVQSADYFGHIPPAPEKRGMFSIFYDLDPQGKRAVLMSIVSGEAVPAVRDLEDKQVVDECMKVLRELFTEQEVPEPSSYFVTHWNKDPWSQMSYSFVKTGGSGEAYDVLAEDVQGKVFFAGEATNRHFPQTVTGAYLSGVREASKMVSL
ncbi:lysine-specific histone demethylase 2 isoform X4 [Nothobranchius furzeri]|uniref:lysine-specific histone demethylase 2 isoform X4 n=1 Tax=Nothobranchius furzeri TaxID=105023 RepID=UPI002403AFFC|nr:lysine-specific histone demethylase 2 isoform X3 [Nothobranchius furzeri]